MPTHRIAPFSFHYGLVRTAILGLVLLCGCAAAGRPASETRSNDRILGVEQTGEVLHTQASIGPVASSIHAPFSAVWAALPQAYASLGIELTVIDRPSATVGNRSFVQTRAMGGRRLSAYFDCGSSMTGMRADEGRMTISAVSRATDVAHSETALATTVTGVVQTNEGASAQTIPCASTGRLEESIRSAVASRAGGT